MILSSFTVQLRFAMTGSARKLCASKAGAESKRSPIDGMIASSSLAKEVTGGDNAFDWDSGCFVHEFSSVGLFASSTISPPQLLLLS